MNKLIPAIIIIAIVAVGVLAFSFLPGNSQTQNTGSPASEQTQPEPSQPNEQSPESGSSSEFREITVTAKEFSYNPPAISVTAGEKVRILFKNEGTMPHDFRIEELDIGTKVISPGQTDTLEFTAPSVGTYTFFCSVGSHRQLGMEGELESQ